MRQKEQRWYEFIDGVYYVYATPIARYSISVSIVKDIDYYRRTFKLQKCHQQGVTT